MTDSIDDAIAEAFADGSDASQSTLQMPSQPSSPLNSPVQRRGGPKGKGWFCTFPYTPDVHDRMKKLNLLIEQEGIVTQVKYWAYSEDPENVIEYGNTTPGVVTDKSVKIKISNMDIDYDILEVAAVYRSDIDSIANTYIIYSKPISSPQEQIVDHRNTVSMGAALLPQEITEITNLPSKVKTLNTKDNRLFLGGLSYSPFNLEFNSIRL